MKEPRFVTHLKEKWQIKNNRDFILIMLVFSLAGSFVCIFRPPLFHLLGIGKQTPTWFKVIIYIPLIMPLYQLGLLFFGLLLGQSKFFMAKQKKLLQFLLKPFRKLLTPH